MPLLRLETNAPLSDDARKNLTASLSRTVADTIGKPEQYVMITITPATLLMSGKPGNAAFADVRSLGGLGGDVPRLLAQRVCKLLNDSLGIPPERVFLNFTDVKPANWGWNGNTFG
jgi:phenylpyruvate tautomerase PptA (4-oxalocrotonate tautomerase family)